MTTMITIQDSDWTRAEIVRGWLDCETQDVAEEAADTEIAHIVNNIHTAMGYGWSYDDGKFTGPYRPDRDPVRDIHQLITEAGDYAVEHIEEIRADALADITN